jgi:hypothetical protein
MSSDKHKLHALLAVEGDIKVRAEKILTEAKKTFKDKGAHFTETTRVYNPLNEDGYTEPDEHDPMVTTVDEKLAYVEEHLTRAFDVTLQKEKTNTMASADLIVDGQTIATAVPATVLLNFESKIKDIRSLYAAIPTLPPGTRWAEDKTRDGVFVAPDKKTYRKEKTTVPVVLYEATEKHPAQVQTVNKDIPVGTITTSVKNGCWTVARKSKALARIDALLEATKRARQSANAAVAVEDTIGKQLFEYISAD